jgi:diacylglycerol O-acyltransferase
MPEGAGPDFVRNLVEQLRSYSQPSAPFNRRLVSRFGVSFWEEDAELDLDLHLRHMALPRPGRVRELLSLVSAEHSTLMDRERPMWEYQVIEGLSQRRFAVYTKVHHGLMDGISFMRLGAASLSTDPKQRDMVPLWATQRRRKTREVREVEATLDYYSRTSARWLAAGPKVTLEALRTAFKARRDQDSVSLYGAPRSILNQRITGSRRVAAQSYSLPRVAAIGKAFGSTVNDAVLAVCGSALRAYLLSQNALPERPLISMVPVSLRSDESAGGNQIGVCLANLGTHLSDPAQRMRVIQHSMNEAKTRLKQMTPEEAMAYSAMTLAPSAYSVFTGLTPPQLSFNVIISNVPGPRETLYLNGARLEGVYPASIVMHQNALNITLTSYRDSLEFGVVGCRRSLPSVQRLLDYIDQGIVELERSAGLPTPRERKADVQRELVLQ